MTEGTISDVSLLKRYAASLDADAFGVLVGRHTRLVFAAAQRICGDSAAAEDVAQECFIALAQQANRITVSIPGWLHQRAVWIALRHRRDLATRRRHEQDPSAAPPIGDASPGGSWVESEKMIDEGIAALPDKLREPLVLHYFESRSQSQIAELLGVSQATVHRRLEAAVEELRKTLKDGSKAPHHIGIMLIAMGAACGPVPDRLHLSLVKIGLGGVAPHTASAAGALTAAIVLSLFISAFGLWWCFQAPAHVGRAAGAESADDAAQTGGPVLTAPQDNRNVRGILSDLPSELLLRLRNAPTAQDGLVGSNKPAWRGAAFQRGALKNLVIGDLCDSSALREDAWRAIDCAISHQAESGNFGDTPSSVAFWLCDVSRALLVHGAFSASDRDADRAVASVRKAVAWLAVRADTLRAEDQHAPGRLIMDANAFFFSGHLLDSPAIQGFGDQFMSMALQAQDGGGAFRYGSGSDTSFQGVCILQLSWRSLFDPAPRIRGPLDAAVRWELQRIDDKGAISAQDNTRTGHRQDPYPGHTLEVSVGEVAFGLLLYGGIARDQAATSAVARIMNRYANRFAPRTGTSPAAH